MFLELFSKGGETWGWRRKQNAAAGWGADLRTRHTGPWWGADLRTRHTGPWWGPGNSSWWSGRGSQWGPGHSQHTPGTNNKNGASRVWRILIRSEPHHIAGSAKKLRIQIADAFSRPRKLSSFYILPVYRIRIWMDPGFFADSDPDS